MAATADKVKYEVTFLCARELIFQGRYAQNWTDNRRTLIANGEFRYNLQPEILSECPRYSRYPEESLISASAFSGSSSAVKCAHEYF